jgi:phenylpropionate dioxygenase-like ring-hydroxylating dioxygenase large terminal subunit
MATLKDFWYIVALSSDLKPGHVLSTNLLDEWLAIYRTSTGKVSAVIDRCMHRNARLSKGKVIKGQLVCPYHGWRYAEDGKLTAIPSEGDTFQTKPLRCITSFPVVEQEGYIYVRLTRTPSAGYIDLLPYNIPHYSSPGYKHIRLKHVFHASVPNCAENFVDIPHTTYVHPAIFRYEKAPQKIEAEVEINNGSVHVRYLNETSNFGIFSKFLNRQNRVIFHEDHYYAPNITHVEYRFGKRMHFNITSQSIPVDHNETHVYTDLTYDYGFWNIVAQPFVRAVGKKIIAQDVRIMDEQTTVMNKYGTQFTSTRADLQHLWIEQIYASLLAGNDPRNIPSKKSKVEFWI